MVYRDELIYWIHNYLNVDKFQDYCPNGLQLQGRSEINLITCAVTSSLNMITKSTQINSDLLIAHHGLIWKGDWNTITGLYYHRVKTALEHNLNIAAYHLPLDAHKEVGNAFSLANLLQLSSIESCFEIDGNPIGAMGMNNLSHDEFLKIIKEKINAKFIIIDNTEIKKVGIVTGGGQSEFQKAIDLGLDTFITGESTEWAYHLANENKVNYIACGHHASEKFGVQNLCNKISETFSVKIEYLDEENPF